MEHDAGEVQRIGPGEAHGAPVGSVLRMARRASAAWGSANCSPVKPRTNLPPATRPRSSMRRSAHWRSRQRTAGRSAPRVVEHDTPSLEERSANASARSSRLDVGRRGGHEGPPPSGLGGTEASGPQPGSSRRGGRSVAASGGDGPHRLEAVRDQQAPRHALPQGRLDVGHHPTGVLRQLAGEARSLRGEHLDHLGHPPAGWHRRVRLASVRGEQPRQVGGSTSDTGVVRVAPARRRSGSSGDGGVSRNQVTSPWWHRRSSQRGASRCSHGPGRAAPTCRRRSRSPGAARSPGPARRRRGAAKAPVTCCHCTRKRMSCSAEAGSTRSCRWVCE